MIFHRKIIKLQGLVTDYLHCKELPLGWAYKRQPILIIEYKI